MNPFRIAKAVGHHTISWLTSPYVTLPIGELIYGFRKVRRRGREVDLSQVKRLLIVRLDEIGDLVMTTPFLRELRHNLPNAWITLVVKPALYNLVELCPYVNEVLTYDWSLSRYLGPLQRHWRALSLAYRHLWPRHFDLAVVPRWDVDEYHATFVAYLSGASRRVGYSENVIDHKQLLNRGFDRLFTHVLNDKTLKHEVEHNLDVVRFLGGTVQEDRLELWVGEDDENFAGRVSKQYGVQPGELVVGFGLSGGNSPLKQWPVNHFIELGSWLQAKYKAYIIVFGGPGDEPLGREVEQGIGSSVINLAGKTTLRQMAALLKRCHLYVGNDAGPMHVAVAMNIPVVALFGSSCHHRFGPWGNGPSVLWLALPCSPCLQVNHIDRCGSCNLDRPHCILGITVEQVKEAVMTPLAQQGYYVVPERVSEHTD